MGLSFIRNLMPLNPWVLLGVLGATLALMFGSFLYGVHTTNTSRDAEALTVQLKAVEKARTIEQDWQAKFNEAQVQRLKEKQNAQALEESLRASIADGTRKLHIAVTQQRLSGDPEGTGGSNGTTAELAPEARQAYYDLRAAAEQVESTLNSCQDYVRVINGLSTVK